MSRTTPAAPLLVWSRDFPATPDRGGEARQFLRVVLQDHPSVDDALLCLSELVTNAMIHSRSREPGGHFSVRAVLHGRHLRVEVRDRGGPWRQSDRVGNDQQNGRGLLIVEQLTAAWGRIGNDQIGWTVWFEIGAHRGQPWITWIDGHQLHRLRHRHQLTRAELASKAGVSPATVARLEQHHHPTCRCRTLIRLATALGTEPGSLTKGP